MVDDRGMWDVGGWWVASSGLACIGWSAFLRSFDFLGGGGPVWGWWGGGFFCLGMGMGGGRLYDMIFERG